jgi:phosphoglycolate phosphatase
MNYDYLIFDLDGTISDPAEGIFKGFNYALKAYAFNEIERCDIARFIGPALDRSFAEITGRDDEQLLRDLVAKYREYYADIGFSENSLYPGISDTLHALSACGDYELLVCTTKREDFAQRILRMFDLRELFIVVSGGDVGISTTQQLAALLLDGKITTRALMIGDRCFDFEAAADNDIDSAAVLWGYGNDEEVAEYKPAFVFATVAEMQNCLL